MTYSSLVSFLAMCALATTVTIVVFAIQRRIFEGDLRRAFAPANKRPWLQRLIVGTDADLKVELTFLVYIFTVLAFVASPDRFGGQLSGSVFHCTIALVQGFHLRRWLSKLRARNIVSRAILTRDRAIYVRGFGEMAELAVNTIFMVVLLTMSPIYAIPQLAGFVAHELAAEVAKRKRMARRKLHLFDISAISEPRTRLELSKAARSGNILWVARAASRAKSDNEGLLLRGFDAWLRNDFDAVGRLFEQNKDRVLASEDATYYFGKAFYSIGDLPRASTLLSHAWNEYSSKLCLSYLILCRLALSDDEATIASIDELRRANPPNGEAVGDMFLAAYSALAIAIGLNAPEEQDSKVGDAFSLIHRAMLINEQIYNRLDSSNEFREDYYESNHQIFLDIYGYIVFKQGHLQLSFAILESAIKRDDTYPWPYYHLALVYEAVGRTRLAGSIYYRIAANEVSNSVLKVICTRRIERLAAASTP